jgi:predicted unusual protein kinase regulating ubiquinone biosynthesis (AarF/ABC1/UbiB family)
MRPRRIARAVERGLERWRQQVEAEVPPAPPLLAQEPDSRDALVSEDIVLRPLPKPRPLEVAAAARPAEAWPRLERTPPGVRFTRVLGRLLIWLGALVGFLLGNAGDALLRRGSPERQAIRLRELLERVGGTAIKIGQQLAMRIDLLPYTYGVELSKLFDRVPPFPVEQAIARIEQSTGRPLGETFQSFDPEPIGSASLACVFQGVLKSGERVAVKVRRPFVEEAFAADCEALRWVAALLEGLTVLRPGFLRNVVRELRDMLLEELDFVKEARSQEIFSQRTTQARLRFVTAPKVYFELSGRQVLVTEFVSGLWLSDLLKAVEHRDEAILERLRREAGIDPKVIARQLLRLNHFGIFENILFHGDPHPANILVRPGNELVLIDFGACGAYTRSERDIWRQLAYSQAQEDVGGMVRCALALLEPLPAIDTHELTRRLERLFWEDQYAFKSKHVQWWERTSMRVWLGFLDLVREYNVPINLNTLRMIRSTLLYETVAARLYNRVSTFREYRKYNRDAARRARKRMRGRVIRTLTQGPSPEVYQTLEQLEGLANRGLYWAQRVLDAPVPRYLAMVGKVALGMRLLLETILSLAVVALLFALSREAHHFAKGHPHDVVESLFWAFSHGAFLTGAAVLGVLQFRRWLFRLRDVERAD